MSPLGNVTFNEFNCKSLFSVFFAQLTCTVETAWRAPHVSCSESELVLAGNVGGKVWADGSAGPGLQPEPFCSTGLVAVGSACPGTKDEGI